MARLFTRWWAGFILTAVSSASLVAGVAELPGCASNPVAAAQDSEQRAYAIYGTFVIVEEQSAKIIANPATTPELALIIRSADSRAKPAADALLQAVRDYDAATAALKAGSGTTDKLTVATSNLQKWVTEAGADVTDLVNAVKQGT